MNSCYLIVFYFGDRRRKFPPFEEDRLCYVKKNIESLTRVKNSLDKIYFIFNVEPDHYDLLNQAIELIPKKIQSAEVEIIIRQNIGISYGAWSEIIDNKNHDYYIFNEDDMFFIEDGWDRYMIKSFEEKENCGGFGAVIRPGRKWNYNKEHFGCSAFVTSKEVAKNIKENYGGFNFKPSTDYRSSEDNQINFSWDLIRAGYNIYDVRDDYRVYCALTSDQEMNKIHEYFMWNEKPLLVTDTVAWGMNYVWWRSGDEEFQQNFREMYPHPNLLKTSINR